MLLTLLILLSVKNQSFINFIQIIFYLTVQITNLYMIRFIDL